MKERKYVVNEVSVLSEMMDLSFEIKRNLKEKDSLSMLSNLLQITRLKVYAGITNDTIETVTSRAFYYLTQRDNELEIYYRIGRDHEQRN